MSECGLRLLRESFDEASMYLKAIIFSVCFLGLSFVGMQVAVKMRANEAASRRTAAAK
jgi:hypothetical protein